MIRALRSTAPHLRAVAALFSAFALAGFASATWAATPSAATTPAAPSATAPQQPDTSPAAAAVDRADIERTTIVGNRELPKVLYIVPWKKPLPGALDGHPPHSVLDEALSPLDKDVFQRQLKYREATTAPATGR